MAKLAELQPYIVIATVLLFSVLLLSIQGVSGLGCFVCSSVNHSNPDCEDTFNGSTEYYQPQCKAGRKTRSGLFPGTECIKLKAELGNHTVLVRDCTVHNGDLTSDTEMGGNPQCSMVNLVEYNNKMMYGCAVSCGTDGCNRGSDVIPKLSHVSLGLCLSLVFHWLRRAWSC